MNGVATLQAENGRLMLSGDLNFASVVTIWHESLPFLKSNEKIIIDFSRVTTANSAGLALMVEWIKWAAKQGRSSISFVAIPEQILSIAKVSGLEAILK